ncbi:MAG: exo-beta-N-acetylmuramidase NamZ domain-containing protein [Bacteroidota bacterium]
MKNSKANSRFLLLQKYIKMWQVVVLVILSCISFSLNDPPVSVGPIIPGAYQMDQYMDSLIGKNVAVVANPTSMVKQSHLVDTLLYKGVVVTKIFAPEHGFRGDGDAGEHINSGVDEKTGISVVSLYGNHKKPTPIDLKEVQAVVFDIQDVGVRFYTYLSTLHYVMEACAENNLPLIVLDRPNPNGHYIDGPILEPEFKSFIGLHPVPIVYGMTIGEYAKMINGEGWLNGAIKCNLKVISILNYTHKSPYSLPIPPSPNLKSDLAIALYPSLCLFEATTVSVGRGTDRPFEMYGHPRFPKDEFEFTPKMQPGSKYPPHLNKVCPGVDLRTTTKARMYELNLFYLTNARDILADSAVFINQNSFFNRLAGNAQLKEQLYKGWGPKEIRATWSPGLEAFQKIRAKYLIYR